MNKLLYVETSSLELKEARATGLLRCIIGDAIDVDIRDGQYKATRKQDFFHRWSITGHRDHAVHHQLKRPIYRDRVVYATDDVQTVEAFDFIVNPKWSTARMKQFVIETIGGAVQTIDGEVATANFIPTTWQRRAIEFVASSLEDGKSTLLLELAARFGKTGTLVQLFDYSDADVMVVANYVKTVNRSFADTVVKFFSDRITCIDVKDADFQEKLQATLDAGRKALVTCSLFRSPRLDAQIEAITAIDKRFIVVDEADFGAHTKSQRTKVEALREGVPLILMTGTEADRARASHPVDAHLAVTYFDMLMEAE